MMKKSRSIAVLLVCVVMFGVVEPAFAWGNRTGSQAGDAAVIAGASVGGVAVGAAAPIVAPIVTGALGGATGAEIAGGAIATGGAGNAIAEGVKSATMQTAQAVNDNKETIRQSVTNAFREAPAEFIKGAASGAGKAVGVGAGVMVLSTVIPSEDKQILRDFLTK